MIPIDKNNAPQSLIDYKNQPDDPNISYGNLPTDVKKEVQLSLAKEQYYLCAYCMGRIIVNDKENNSKDSNKLIIEHWCPQSENEALALEYKNLLGCCKGHIIGEGRYCEETRGTQDLKYNPSNREHHQYIEEIYYSADGRIHSKDSEFDKQLTDVLKLNLTGVIAKRWKALDGVIQAQAYQKFTEGDDDMIEEEDYEKLYNTYKAPEDGKLVSFCGFILYYLKHHEKF